ncbi:MAG: alpha/beta hydrolase [Xanthomonadaceae bacterium]|nr:alpha/beta hydrolase [Xanthomonadaceae bacterium]
MKPSRLVLSALVTLWGACVHAAVWQPGPGLKQIPIWPGTPPGAQALPGPESVTPVTDKLVAGKPWQSVRNVSRPTYTVYPPRGTNTGAAVVVFPGGGFEILAIDLEGSEACDWLTARGITCVLLKYRVPGIPYDWHCDCRAHDFAIPTPALQDAQRTIRLVRQHAAAWHIDPHRIGVLGFSAGGYLVAQASTNYDLPLYRPVDADDRLSARPDFAVAVYPGHLARNGGLNRNVPVTRNTPPTFIVMAGDDRVDGVQQALAYYTALQKAGVSVEMHLYAHGGHAFGLRPDTRPITRWPHLVEAWLRQRKVIGYIENRADMPTP